MRIIVTLLASLGIITGAAAKQRVVLISVDGLMGALVEKGYTPNIKAVAEKGHYTFKANSVLPPKTIPAHASMLTGLKPQDHKMLNNSYNGKSKIAVKTIFDFLKAKNPRLTTAAVVGKLKLANILSKNGSVDHSSTPIKEDKYNPKKWGSILMRFANYRPYQEVIKDATLTIKKHDPNFLFVHFADVDWMGHWYGGWDKYHQYMYGLFVDHAIGQIVSLLEKNDPKMLETTIIITADHGGHGSDHGVEGLHGGKINTSRPELLNYGMFHPEDYLIPLVAYGPGHVGGTKIKNQMYLTDIPAMIAKQFGFTW